MSASSAAACSAVAFQLVTSLEAYDGQLEQLLHSPLDSALYQAASLRMDDLRLYSSALPQVSVCWVELLIRHFEFTHAMWRVHRDECTEDELHRLHAQLVDASRTLAGKATQLIRATA